MLIIADMWSDVCSDSTHDQDVKAMLHALAGMGEALEETDSRPALRDERDRYLKGKNNVKGCSLQRLTLEQHMTLKVDYACQNHAPSVNRSGY